MHAGAEAGEWHLTMLHQIVVPGLGIDILEGLGYFRIRFVADENGATTILVGVYDDGSESLNE